MEIPNEHQFMVRRFRALLAGVYGPDDMFPPDDFAGDREPRLPQPPTDVDEAQLCLAGVYDLQAYNS